MATRSAHKVVGYALDSILQPNITKLFVVIKAAPTGYLLYGAFARFWATMAFFIRSSGTILLNVIFEKLTSFTNNYFIKNSPFTIDRLPTLSDA